MIRCAVGGELEVKVIWNAIRVRDYLIHGYALAEDGAGTDVIRIEATVYTLCLRLANAVQLPAARRVVVDQAV